MTISLRLNDADSNLIQSYAKLHNISISELFRRAVLEQIEQELDLNAFDKALQAHHADPVCYAHEDVLQMLDLG